METNPLDLELEQDNQEAPLETDGQQQQEEQAPLTEQEPSLDYRQLYVESLRERAMLEAQMQSQFNAPTQQQPESNEPRWTAEDLASERAPQVLEDIISRTLDKKLSAQLGDIQQLGLQYKRENAMRQAEELAFRMNPQLAEYREQLAPQVREALAKTGVEPNAQAYNIMMYATLGQLAVAAKTQTPAQMPNTPPQNTPRKPPARQGLTRLTETEKAGMRRVGLDPNKAEDISRFHQLISDDSFYA